MTTRPDFKAHCHDACLKLWGPADTLSPKEFRWNGADAYSPRVFNVRNRVWYDHGAKRGGSTLELVAYHLGWPADVKLRGEKFIEIWHEAYRLGCYPDPPEGGGGRKPIRETFPYPNESGALLFEVVRFDTEEKDGRFRQRRPNGKGGWIYKVKGVRQVLYRLPQLIAAVKAGQRILNTEGERDTNTAVKLGYAATTNPGGVGKWRKEYDEFFRSADVVIIADNDVPGRAFANAKARRLVGIAARVRVVVFAQKDLTEWVEAGGTREQLDAIIEQTEEFKSTQPPTDEEDKLGGFYLEDLGGFEDKTALEFSGEHADDLRYVAAWKQWLQWDGVRWCVERTLLAYDLARGKCREVGEASAQTVAAIVTHARADRRQAATVEQWDADPWKLGTPDGTVDLRTGKLSPPVPMDYITKITAVAPSDAPPGDSCPMYLTFINRVTGGNEELQDYLQRMCGYMLTGITKEDALFFAYGKGQNGKSVFLNTIADIMMDYHETAPMEMFTVTKVERHPTDLASLRGARLVTAVETEEGKRWDEAKLKAMTGGEPIKARLMRQDFFTFVPLFKLLFAGNFKPAIRNVDKAISRRLNLLPFLVTIPDDEKDLDLRNKLRAEWPGILRWMIDGCLAWQKDGLKPPKIVTAATESYLQAQDNLQRFLDEACTVGKNESDSIEHIWDGWVDWAEDCGEYVGTKRRLGERLDDKGFERDRGGHGGVRMYRGLRCIRENAKKLRAQAKASNGPFFPLRGMKQDPTVPCARCGKTGEVYIFADGRVPKDQRHYAALHDHCAEPYFTGKPSQNEPGISAQRARQLAEWYTDEAHRRHTTNTLDTPTLDTELRAILREEVAAPEQVQAAFERVMEIVFAT